MEKINETDFQTFIADFKSKYELGLLGKPAQYPLKPYVGVKSKLDIPVPKSAKKGAVLALLYPKNNIPYLALMQRPAYNGVHSNQISFPGGKIEPDDKSPMAAALRETFEEVGVTEDKIKVLGPLTEVFVLASNFLVYPFVGYCEETPIFDIDTREVAEIIELPLYDLFDDAIIKERKMQSKIGVTLNAPYYDVLDKILWGATAMMISELVAIARRV